MLYNSKDISLLLFHWLVSSHDTRFSFWSNKASYSYTGIQRQVVRCGVARDCLVWAVEGSSCWAQAAGHRTAALPAAVGARERLATLHGNSAGQRDGWRRQVTRQLGKIGSDGRADRRHTTWFHFETTATAGGSHTALPHLRDSLRARRWRTIASLTPHKSTRRVKHGEDGGVAAPRA
jgi:hypothetical protein